MKQKQTRFWISSFLFLSCHLQQVISVFKNARTHTDFGGREVPFFKAVVGFIHQKRFLEGAVRKNLWLETHNQKSLAVQANLPKSHLKLLLAYTALLCLKTAASACNNLLKTNFAVSFIKSLQSVIFS